MRLAVAQAHPPIRPSGTFSPLGRRGSARRLCQLLPARGEDGRAKRRPGEGAALSNAPRLTNLFVTSRLRFAVASHKSHEQPAKPNDSHRHKPNQSMHLRDRGKNGCHQRNNKKRQTICETAPRCMGAGHHGLTKKRLKASEVTRGSNLGSSVEAMFLKFAALFSSDFEPLQKSTTVTFAHFPSNLTRHNQRVSRTQASSQVRLGTLGSLLRTRANETSSGKIL